MADIDIRIVDHTGETLRDLDSNEDLILEALGLQATGYAQLNSPVDTGLLRNSLTYAIAGEQPVTSTYKANSADNSGNIREGRYEGSTTKQGNEKAVYIGTNVEYAVYQELGSTKTQAQPFIKPAIVDHKDEYKRIIEKGLKGELTE